jgi:hypothetical protein
VDNYKDNALVSHDGTWLSGIKDAKFGLIMPGQLSLNMGYYQELAPSVAMDRAKIVSVSEAVKTPAGEYTNCLKAEETTPSSLASRSSSTTPLASGWCRTGR